MQMINKKYKLLLNDTIRINRLRIAYRIEAVKDFGDVKSGDKGGYVESIYNLSENGDCWVYENCIVLENAEIFDNAKIKGETKIYGGSNIGGNATIIDSIIGKEYGYNNINISGDVYLERVFLSGSEYVDIFNNVKIEVSSISGNISLHDNVTIKNLLFTNGTLTCTDDVQIKGPILIKNTATLKSGTVIENATDNYININNPIYMINGHITEKTIQHLYTYQFGKWLLYVYPHKYDIMVYWNAPILEESFTYGRIDEFYEHVVRNTENEHELIELDSVISLIKLKFKHNKVEMDKASIKLEQHVNQ